MWHISHLLVTNHTVTSDYKKFWEIRSTYCHRNRIGKLLCAVCICWELTEHNSAPPPPHLSLGYVYLTCLLRPFRLSYLAHLKMYLYAVNINTAIQSGSGSQEAHKQLSTRVNVLQPRRQDPEDFLFWMLFDFPTFLSPAFSCLI